MKKVIFVCLLSLSVCLSKPSEQQAAPAPNVPPADAKTPPPKTADPALITAPGPPADAKSQPPKAPEPAPTTPTAPVHDGAQPNKNAIDTKPVAQPAANTTQTPVVPAAPEAKPKDDTKPNDKDNKTNDEKKDALPPKGKDGKVEPPKEDKNTPASGTADNKNGLKPDGKGEVTTPKTDVSTKAAETPGDIHVVQARGFDGPSFIGGIILTLGLLAIGFMGFKYYKNKTERNYHTL